MEFVFDFLTLPFNWANYLPTTVDVTPAIKRNYKVGDRVTETISIWGSKTHIQWTCKAYAIHSFYEIEGISGNHGGSKTFLSYEFSSLDGNSGIKRVIRHRFDKLGMRIFNPLWKLYFMYEANSAFKRAKKILESMPDSHFNKGK